MSRIPNRAGMIPLHVYGIQYSNETREQMDKREAAWREQDKMISAENARIDDALARPAAGYEDWCARRGIRDIREVFA